MVRCLTKLSMLLNPPPPPPLPPPPPQNQRLLTPIPHLSRQARAPLLHRQQNYKSGLSNVRNAHDWGRQKETISFSGLPHKKPVLLMSSFSRIRIQLFSSTLQ